MLLAIYFTLGGDWAMRFAGLVLAIFSADVVAKKRIKIGIRGWEARWVTGKVAVVLGFAALLLGLTIAIWPSPFDI